MTTPHPLHASRAPDDAVVARRAAVSVPDATGKTPARGFRMRVPELRQEPADRPASGPRLDEDMLQLFYQVEALRSDRAPYVLQFIGVAPGTGVSTLAQGFSLAAAQEYRAPVLLLEGVSRGGPPSVTTALRESGAVNAAVHPVAGFPHLFRAALVDEKSDASRMTVSELADVLNELRDTFVAVILDCPSVQSAGPVLALCRHCDGTVLVVQAERDRRREVGAALEVLGRLGGVVLGTVLNRQKSHLPRWLDKWLG